jgi:hypothetical protein
MVIIKLHINNRGPYNFLLDTGVGLMIITDPKLVDSIAIRHHRVIKLTGLGEGEDFEALVTPNLNIEIPGMRSIGVAAAILKQDYFNLSSYAGMPIHGILGFDFFNSLAVKISFRDSMVTVSRPWDIRGVKKSSRIPITIEDRKPYVETMVTFPGGKKVKNKLIIDLGAGHPLSLENLIAKNGLPQKFIAANLGIAINGPISGYLSRMEEIELGKYKLKNIITSFPDDIHYERRYSVSRDGNIGIGILKRFDVVFDYYNSVMYLKSNQLYKDPFECDMSGIEYYATGEDLNHLIINRIAPGSPASEIGLEKGDEIMSINLKPVSKMNIEEVDNYFKSKNERSLLLEIYHDKKYDKVILTLKRRI